MSELEPLFELETGEKKSDSYVSINTQFLVKEEEKDYDVRTGIQKAVDYVLRRKKYFARTIHLNGTTEPVQNFGSNAINNRKFHIVFFLFQFLWEQFKLFSNMYYLLTAVSQFVPFFQVGYLFTYIAPLVFVLAVTFVKDMFDDLLRFKRDMEINLESYEKITPNGETVPIKSHLIRVGDLIKIKCDQRVPCDCLLIKTSEKNGSSFIRTSSLDGETDWKLRHTIPYFQNQDLTMDIINSVASFYVEAPKKDIYDFFGRCTYQNQNNNQAQPDFEPLNLQNTLWGNTHVATGDVVGLAIYVGDESRSVLNKQEAVTKTGKVDKELNNQMKLLFVIMFILSLVCVLLKKQFEGFVLFTATFVRYLILFSSIIPISLKVNMDLSKTVYSFIIGRDKKIKGAVVRNSSIPEELGRIDHLFCDKTGTLTMNEMIFKRLFLGGENKYSNDKIDLITQLLKMAYENQNEEVQVPEKKIQDIIRAIALCHNVTPCYVGSERKYEASSPDEQSLVSFAESVGLVLEKRDLKSMELIDPTGKSIVYDVLLMFPFTSAAKRMGIFVRERNNDNVLFLMKGADVVMRKVIKKQGSEWLAEDCDELAREGLRTLVFAQKEVTTEEFELFQKKFKEAKASLSDRDEKIKQVRDEFETDMDLIGLTGVEDLLQSEVANVLENFKNAGINCWMLTGDKVETAICIGRSTRLIDKQQEISKLIGSNESDIEDLLALHTNSEDNNLALVLDGKSLSVVLDGGSLEKQFVNLCNTKCSSVVVARCAPTQKAQVVKLVKKNSKNITTAAIGDGGNDVSMILEAHVGIGIVGKEGKQASLAADFSIDQFSHLQRLVLWHGTNSYRRAAKMSQFIVHRGMIISIIQAVFSAIYFFATIPIFTGMLLVGYSTFYTVLPVFAICMDTELNEKVVTEFPEIYKALQKHKLLSFRTFLHTTWKACYQGGVIMLVQLILAVFFVSSSNLLRMQSIAYTALIFTELIMIGLTSFRLNLIMIGAEILSVFIYVLSIVLLPSYFDTKYVFSLDFLWKTSLIIAISTLPIYLTEFIYNKLKPSQHSKLSHRRESVKKMINEQLMLQGV